MKTEHTMSEPMEAPEARNTESESAVAGSGAGWSCTHRGANVQPVFDVREFV